MLHRNRSARSARPNRSARTARSAAFSAVSALALLGIVLASVVAGPAPAAQAQAGYRICTVFTKGPGPDRYGSGVVIKLPKGDFAHCRQDVAVMQGQFGTAHIGKAGVADRRYTAGAMSTIQNLRCEDFTYRSSGHAGDVCSTMEPRKFYTFVTSFDRFAPSPAFAMRDFF